MNSINFVTTPPPDKLQAVCRWYHITFSSCALMVIALATINGYQYYQLQEKAILKKQLREVTENISTSTQHMNELKAHEAKLSTQRTKMNATKQFKPSNYVRAFANSIPDDTCLFTADIHKKGTLQLIGYTESADSLRTFMEKLTTTKLVAKLELSSLQPENSKTSQLFKFTLLGQLQTV